MYCHAKKKGVNRTHPPFRCSFGFAVNKRSQNRKLTEAARWNFLKSPKLHIKFRAIRYFQHSGHWNELFCTKVTFNDRFAFDSFLHTEYTKWV